MCSSDLSPITLRPSASEADGSTVRSKNGVAIRTCSSVCPRIRGSRALRYAVMSGSSGMEPTYTTSVKPLYWKWSILGAVKVRDLIRLLESDGWRLKSVRGSHRQFKHPGKRMVVTVAGMRGKMCLSAR